MRRTLPLALIFLSTPAVAGTLSAPILGGTQATQGQFPSVVLVDLGGGLCTGTLITKDWVLTAAHCVLPAELGVSTQAQVTAAIKIHFGTINMNTSAGVVIGASDSMPHPMFNINSLGQHDVGLIKLAKSVTDITPVPINFLAANAPVGIAVTQVGYGATAVGGGGSIGVEMVVPQTSVACGFEGSDTSLLCFNQVSGKGKCQGDSGGPSFAMINGKQIQVGITSFGDQSCSQFGADTRTDAETAFILQHIPELQCDTDADCAMDHLCFEHKCIAMPFTTGGLGATCAGNGDCDSGACASGDGTMKCSMTCTVGTAGTCPDGFDCLGDMGAAGACWPTSTDGGGCCDAGGAGAPTALFGLGFVGLVLRRRKR